LTSLWTNFEVLTSGAELSPEDRAALVSDVSAQLSEMSDLVADLGELARGDRDEEAAQTDVELSAVVSSAIDRVRRRRQDVRIESELSDSLVRGNADLLERAVLNVLDNAVKWTPPDGLVHVSLRDGVITVTDAGPGIPEDDLPHIFERFWRGSSARPVPGSGLGLAIVEQVVTSHGGTVAAHAGAGGVGTVMEIRIPVEP
jgi:two-component system sensor histidine kinase MprB